MYFDKNVFFHNMLLYKRHTQHINLTIVELDDVYEAPRFGIIYIFMDG